MKNITIAVIVADVDEYKPLAERIEKGKYENYSFLGRSGHKFSVETEKGKATVYTLLCGIGMVNAAAVASHFATLGCDFILNYGLSGGINGIRRGELTLADRFLEHDFDLTGIGYKPYEKPCQKYIYGADMQLIKLMCGLIPNVKIGTAVSGDSFICDEQIRDALKSSVGAMSCDMETAAIAYVCEFSQIPFLALRRISDDAGDSATESYIEMNEKAEALLSDIILEFIPVIVNSYEI